MLNITPKGKQAEVMALPTRGHTIVLGSAGSGKTTIALLRAYHLSNLPGNDKVLLVTFNGALVKYIKGTINILPPNLVIENYHKFARGYLNSRGKMPSYNGILSPTGKLYQIEHALDACRKQYPSESTLRRPIEFFYDEITFIEQFGFSDYNEYYNAERIGRASANIKRENRKWVFEVYMKYIEFRKNAGCKYDWDDLAFYTYKELTNDVNKRMYTHIIVDEGQDFSPMMIKSLVCAVAQGGSFSFFGDVAQQIYGSRLSWRDSGITTDRVWKFDVNYRNPKTITDFAYDITQSQYWIHTEDMITATPQVAEGPKPVLISFKNIKNEIEWVIDRAIKLSKKSSAVIICRTRADIDRIKAIISKKGEFSIEIDKDTPGYPDNAVIYLTTYHTSKGLEFENVFLPMLSDEKIPDPDIVSSATSKELAFSDEIKLLYVAVTRSKYGLYMTYSNKLSPLFPKDSLNFDYYSQEDLT